MICDSLRHWGFRIGFLFLYYHIFLQSNFHVLFIYVSKVYLVRGEKLLDNRDTEYPISGLWDSIYYLSCFHVMHSLYRGSLG